MDKVSKGKLKLKNEHVEKIKQSLKSVAKVYNTGTGLVVKWDDIERILNKMKQDKN